MIDLSTLERWMQQPEVERLEFKEAKPRPSTELRTEGRIQFLGQRRSARWYAGPPPETR